MANYRKNLDVPPAAPAAGKDEDLVRMALADQDNFVFIIRRYSQKLSRYIRRLTAISAEDAEDILQEVFIKVYKNLNDFDLDLKFSSWIYRIAHNEVISHHRKRQARPQGHSIGLDDAAARSLASDLDIARGADKRLLKEKISRILERLDEKHREVIVLKYFEEKSYEEISDIIKRPAGTVASLLNKAKQKLRAEIIDSNLKQH